jgi:hypothetical protein
MSYTFTAPLTTYTNQNVLPLITKSLFDARTISLINKQVGLKGPSTLNLMSETTSFAYGFGCGFTSNVGTNATDFTQRTINIVDVKVYESLCPKALQQYWMQSQLPSGSMLTTIPFEEQYATLKVKAIQKALETAVWTGTGAGGSITGFASILSGVTDWNATGGSWTALTLADLTGASAGANVIKMLNRIETNIPADIRGYDDVTIFCGMDMFTIIKQGLVAQNYFNVSYLNGVETYELTLPGSNIRLIGVNGLNGSSDLYFGRLSNFYFGTDLLGEEEKFEIFYAKEADEVRFMCEFKAGVQVAFTDQVGRFMIA